VLVGSYLDDSAETRRAFVRAAREVALLS
jgi:hypothetical protein